jgi:coenzyme F420-reducing hydrogenase alpha subunit
MSRIEQLDAWLSAGRTTSARMLATLRFSDAGFGQSDVPLLPPFDAVAARRFAAALLQDDELSRTPSWQGRPAETGALARRADDALVAQVVAAFGRSAFARFVARLRDFAALLAGTAAPRAGAATLDRNRGLAWLENARGLLVHLAELANGTVTRYRIVAPTEWNFHPEGALAAGLAGTDFPSEPDLRRRVQVLVQSLDPCVACRVEVAHA